MTSTMEEDRMSNITLKIHDLTGDTVLANLDADTLRAEVNALDGERWVFVDNRMVRRDALANIDISDNAEVIVTRHMVAGLV
ncbi:MAG: hypothetical protein CL981_01310 [Euryarchaeota archaeon]|nr:hypothetical protein [Euryarchaeota archaeon]